MQIQRIASNEDTNDDCNKAKVLVGYVYMTKPAVIENMDICKIGRTGNPVQRLSQYGRGRFVHAVTYVSHKFECEKAIKVMFAKCYKPRVDLGAEYFEGDIDEMMASYLHVVQEYSIEEPEPRAYIPRHGMNRRSSTPRLAKTDENYDDDFMGIVADDDIYLPYCNEIHIDEKRYLQLQHNVNEHNHEDVQVHIPCNAGTIKNLTVPSHVLYMTQVFCHHLAYEKYKIQKQMDKKFYDAYMPDACSRAGRRKAITRFFAWERYASSMKNMSDCNSLLFYTDDANKYHRELIFGQELLLSLLGSYEEIKKLETEECKVCLPKETFKERLHAYISGMSEKQLAGIVHAFEFHSSRHESKEIIIASKKGAFYFAKKILSDAFEVELSGCRRKVYLDGSFWGHLKSMLDQHVNEEE